MQKSPHVLHILEVHTTVSSFDFELEKFGEQKVKHLFTAFKRASGQALEDSLAHIGAIASSGAAEPEVIESMIRIVKRAASQITDIKRLFRFAETEYFARKAAGGRKRSF